VCGTNDIITPPAESRRIARHIRGARLELLPGAGHMLMLERADELDRLITEFAAEVQRERVDGGRRADDREATG
jgi:pimeloyl-ACP methyl ester carboxylesterase